MPIGTCVGCGIDELELNEDGFCADCAELEGGEIKSDETEGLIEEEG